MALSRPLLVFVLAAMTACGQPVGPTEDRTGPPQQPSPSTAASDEGGVAQVSSLAGEWRVAGIDGRSLDEPMGLALTGDDGQLWWEPRCAGMARTWRIDGSAIAFGSTQPPRPAGSPTPPVCAIAVGPVVQEVFRALDDAVRIARTPENGVLISGPSHSVTLFSQ